MGKIWRIALSLGGVDECRGGFRDELGQLCKQYDGCEWWHEFKLFDAGGDDGRGEFGVSRYRCGIDESLRLVVVLRTTW